VCFAGHSDWGERFVIDDDGASEYLQRAKDHDRGAANLSSVKVHIEFAHGGWVVVFGE